METRSVRHGVGGIGRWWRRRVLVVLLVALLVETVAPSTAVAEGGPGGVGSEPGQMAVEPGDARRSGGLVTPVEIEPDFEEVASIPGLRRVFGMRVSEDGSQAIVSGELTGGAMGLWVVRRSGRVTEIPIGAEVDRLHTWASVDGRHLLVETRVRGGGSTLYRTSSASGWVLQRVRMPRGWVPGRGSRGLESTTDVVIGSTGVISIVGNRPRRSSALFTLPPGRVEFERISPRHRQVGLVKGVPGHVILCSDRSPTGGELQFSVVDGEGEVWSRSVELPEHQWMLCSVSADGSTASAALSITENYGTDEHVVAFREAGDVISIGRTWQPSTRPGLVLLGMSPDGSSYGFWGRTVDFADRRQRRVPALPPAMHDAYPLVNWHSPDRATIYLTDSPDTIGIAVIDPLRGILGSTVIETAPWMRASRITVTQEESIVVYSDYGGGEDFRVLSMSHTGRSATVMRVGGHDVRVSADGTTVWAAQGRVVVDEGSPVVEVVFRTIDRG